MKFIITFIIILLLFTSCASSRSWNKQEKIAAGFFLVAHSADAITTSRAINNGNYEMNPILGKYPSDTEIGIHFSITAIGALILCHFYPDLRKPFLYSCGAVNSLCAIHNYNLNR